MAAPRIISIDGKRFYSEVAVCKLLKRKAESVRRIAGNEKWDFYKKTARGGLYYDAVEVDDYLAAINSPQAKPTGGSTREQPAGRKLSGRQPNDALSLDLPDELAVMIDRYVTKLREEMPFFSITRHDAVLQLISEGLKSEHERLPPED